MSKTNQTFMQNVRANPLPWIVYTLGLFFLLANIWIVTKLAPIAQDLAVITTRVEAVEIEATSHVDKEVFQFVKDSLISIEGKLDTHLGIAHER